MPLLYLPTSSGLLWDTCQGAGVVAATGEWSVGCEGDNHLCKVWESLSMSFQLSGNTHIASLCVLAKTRDIKVQDTAEPQLNMNKST